MLEVSLCILLSTFTHLKKKTCLEFLKLTFFLWENKLRKQNKSHSYWGFEDGRQQPGRVKWDPGTGSVWDLWRCGYRSRDLPLLTFRVALQAPHTWVTPHGTCSQPSERKNLWAGNHLAGLDVLHRVNWTAQQGFPPCPAPQGVQTSSSVYLLSFPGFSHQCLLMLGRAAEGTGGRAGEHHCPHADFWLDVSFSSWCGGRGPRKTSHCMGTQAPWLLAADCVLELTVCPADRHK